jgi:hypothetical protein
VNAWKGTFVEVAATFFGSYLGGQNNYQVYEFDFRKYQQIKRPGQTLAFQLHGFVLFAGAGSVGQDPSEFSNWLPCVGIGYRFQVQPRMNLRIDFGFGLESTGFYFNFNEAY